MEGLRDGIEALVESLQREIASTTSSNNSSQSNIHSSHPNLPQSRCVGFASPVNAFGVKNEASPAMSDSAKTTGSVSVEVSIHEAVNSPGASCITGPAGMLNPANQFSSDAPRNFDRPPRRGAHRRARSEIPFRPQDELLLDSELCFDSSEFLTLSDETGEELLSGYLDMENTNSSDGYGPATFTINENFAAKSPDRSRSFSVDQLISELDTLKPRPGIGESHGPSRPERPHHHHSFSMDGSISFSQDLLMNDSDSLDTKKTVDANKLAELALLDPKRAKRIMANRQSAARSKERKMRYIAELERKVQTLQTEATSLSNQLAILQRDTTGLSIENNELKLRLQAMEQQGQLRDALNETLKDEVQRLKSATVQLSMANGHTYAIGTHHFAQNQSYFQIPPQAQLQHDTQLQQAPASHSNSLQPVQPSDHHQDFIQQGPFG